MAKGSSGGKRGGSAGGGGVESEVIKDLQEELDRVPENLRNIAAGGRLSLTRSEEADADALNLLRLTERQGNIIAKMKDADKELDKIEAKMKMEIRNENRSKVINELEAQKKKVKQLRDNLGSKSKQMDDIKSQVNAYSKKALTEYKSLNPISNTKNIQSGKYFIVNKNAGLFQKDEMLNPKVSGKVFGSLGYTKDKNNKDSVILTHLPSGLSLGSFKKSNVTKDNLIKIHNVSAEFNHYLSPNNKNAVAKIAEAIKPLR